LKIPYFILPLVALAAVVTWNWSRWRAVSSQETQNRVLTERVQAARLDPGFRAATSTRGSGATASLGKEPIHWKNLARQIAESADGDGLGINREMLDFHAQLSKMDRDEIIAALEEIESTEMDDDSRSILEEMLVGPLIEMDPAYALDHFAGRIPNEDDGIAWQLSTALGNWAKQDVTAAAAWFDRQIAAGLFDSKSLDGRSQARVEFEAALAGSMLDQNATEVGKRIAALPEDQRREALEQISFTELGPSGQTAYAALVRGLVPEDERAGSFVHVISELIPEGGYERVGSFLDEIKATPEERVVSAREAANARIHEISSERSVSRQDIDAMRGWLERQAPGTADRVTGEALAEASQDSDVFGFAEASKLALEYHRSSGNDDVLIAFLESYAARSNVEEALPLAEQISDPKLRQEILDRLK
jgi:hypothetical protein